MTRALAVFDRFIVFIFGLLLLAGGLIPAAYYWEIPYVSHFLDTQIDRGKLVNVQSYSWFDTALIVTTALLALLGLWFLLANIQNRSFSNSPLSRDDGDGGTTTLNIRRIAEAACEQLELSPLISAAKPAVQMLGKRPTATFTVSAPPGAPLKEVTRLLELSDEDIAQACEGVDFDTVYKLQFNRVGT
ncbi:hypothetical protein [Corynebacterium mayonis]|uniref:hypothetical protein n=1 Tax=Corynebacterium mayonis TaxID=3062461 RepID=UPI0031404566